MSCVTRSVKRYLQAISLGWPGRGRLGPKVKLRRPIYAEVQPNKETMNDIRKYITDRVAALKVMKSRLAKK